MHSFAFDSHNTQMVGFLTPSVFKGFFEYFNKPTDASAAPPWTSSQASTDPNSMRPGLPHGVIEGVQVARMYDESVDMAAHLEGFLQLVRAPDAPGART